MAKLVIDEAGTIAMIYRDELRGLLAEGGASIRRASHVEPTEAGEWAADLSPIGGPVLGPFETRQAALDAEVAWIEERGL